MKVVGVLLIIVLFFIASFSLNKLTGSTVAESPDQCLSLEGGARNDCYFEKLKCRKLPMGLSGIAVWQN